MKKPVNRNTPSERIALWMKIGPLAVVLGLVGVMMLQGESSGPLVSMPPHASAPVPAPSYSLVSPIDVRAHATPHAMHVAQR